MVFRTMFSLVISFFLWGIGDYRPDIRQEFYGGGLGVRKQIGVIEPYFEMGFFAIESSPAGKGPAKVFINTGFTNNVILNGGITIRF